MTDSSLVLPAILFDNGTFQLEVSREGGYVLGYGGEYYGTLDPLVEFIIFLFEKEIISVTVL